MTRWRWWLVSLALGCSSVSRERDEGPTQVTRAQLSFSEPAEAARFDSAYACFASREGWTQRPLEVRGNFIEADWCTEDGSCSARRNRERAGARWASVGTLHYPKDGATTLDTFGVQVSVGERNAQGWSVDVTASSNGQRILGEHAFLNFTRHDDPEAAFSVGLRYGWRIEEREFFHTIDEDPWSWLARVRSSPAMLRDEALATWTGLRDEVVAALETGDVRKCVYGEYQGDGIPPECVEQVPLSADEVARERARIEARLASVKRAMEQVDELHDAVVRLAPTRCF